VHVAAAYTRWRPGRRRAPLCARLDGALRGVVAESGDGQLTGEYCNSFARVQQLSDQAVTADSLEEVAAVLDVKLGSLVIRQQGRGREVSQEAAQHDMRSSFRLRLALLRTTPTQSHHLNLLRLWKVEELVLPQDAYVRRLDISAGR
jgi:hypothetical protein